jgi:murein DD-endopeptidase MepM/ murein hydrolase activator NlpD
VRPTPSRGVILKWTQTRSCIIIPPVMTLRSAEGPERSRALKGIAVLLFTAGAAGGVGWSAVSPATTTRSYRASLPRTAPDASATSGTCHTVERGQTLYAIARIYKVAPEKVVQANGLADPSHIETGRILFIPGATRRLKPPPPPRPRFAWPIRGPITSGFGSVRNREHHEESYQDHHEGIDIDGVMGQVVRAAAAGRVIWAGTERGYGNMVVLDHGEGYTTVYAHASRLLVGEDESVEAGEPIAEVGDTGNARGAHLHFEVRRDGRPINPLVLLEAASRASAVRAAARSEAESTNGSP